MGLKQQYHEAFSLQREIVRLQMVQGNMPQGSPEFMLIQMELDQLVEQFILFYSETVRVAVYRSLTEGKMRVNAHGFHLERYNSRNPSAFERRYAPDYRRYYIYQQYVKRLHRRKQRKSA